MPWASSPSTSEAGPIFGWAGSNAALVVWPIALAACALAGWVFGFLALRTRGVQFIMITLAFGQMVYFILVSLQFYGGDDGLMISARNTLPGINLESPLVFYYVPGAADGLDAPVHAHHQLALRHGAAGAAPERAARAESGRGAHAVPSGAFVLSAVGTGLAGVLWANYAGLVTPDMAAWTKSGELMAIVILGGVGTLLGPIAGAAVFLGLEQVLTSLTEHWLLYMGPILVLVVLCGQRACSAASGDAPC